MRYSQFVTSYILQLNGLLENNSIYVDYLQIFSKTTNSMKENISKKEQNTYNFNLHW